MTKRKRCDILYKLSARAESETDLENWTTKDEKTKLEGEKSPEKKLEGSRKFQREHWRLRRCYPKNKLKVKRANQALKEIKAVPSTVEIFFREFDPGSGWTLAACITHSSRTDWFDSLLLKKVSGGRVSNAWATCLSEGDNTGKLVLIPHEAYEQHCKYVKGAIRRKMGSRLIR